MGYGIARTARSRKAKAGLRALLGRAPSAAEVGDRLVRLAKRMLRGQVVDATPRRVTVQLHPFASPARIVVRPDGDLEFAAETLALGPGYHVDAMARFTALVDELDFQWVGDDPDPKAGMLAAVGEILRGDGPVALGMPAERTFVVDAPVLTALGPRDAGWRASPERWPDAFAWWDTGPGQRARADALLAMWHELPWRAPLDDDERAAMARVDALLAAARAADPAISLPMAAWAELRGLLGEDVSSSSPSSSPSPSSPIGYRRYDVIAEIADWTLQLPGAFLGGWRDDVYIATDGDRSLELVTVTVDGDHSAAELLAIAPARFDVIARTDTARAEAYDEDGKRVIHGLVAVPPHVAIVTCKGDEAWGLATWRSLRR